MPAKKISRLDSLTMQQHKDIARFLNWRDKMLRFAKELEKDKKNYAYRKQVLSMAKRLDKMKLSDLGL